MPRKKKAEGCYFEKLFSLKSHHNAALPRGCSVRWIPKKQTTLPALPPFSAPQVGRNTAVQTHARKQSFVETIWTRGWAFTGSEVTATARILRFVVLPATTLQGVPISKGMEVWESTVLNATSLQLLSASLPGAAQALLCCRQRGLGLPSKGEQVRKTGWKGQESWRELWLIKAVVTPGSCI